MSKNKSSKPGAAPSIDNPGDIPEAPDSTRLDKLNERDVLDTINRLRRELDQSGGFVTLQRRNPLFNLPDYQRTGGQIDIKEFSIEYVTRVYGGGDFKGHCRNRGGNFEQQFAFAIDHTIPPKNPLAPEKEKGAAPIDVAAILREAREHAPKPDNTALTEAMKQNTAIVTAALARPESNSAMQMFDKLATMQQQTAREFREAMEKSESRFMRAIEAITANREPPKTFLEQLQEFKAMQELMGGKSDDERDEGWAKEIGKGIASVAVPMIKEHFAGGGAVAGGPAINRRALPLRPTPSPASSPQHKGPVVEGTITHENGATPPPATAAPAGTETQPTEEMTILMRVKLTMMRNSALAAAAKGRDARDWLDGLLLGQDEADVEKIFEPANKPDWFTTFFAEHPLAHQHIKFLNEVRVAVLDLALVHHVKKFAAGEQQAVYTAEQFIGWVTQDYHDELLSLTDNEGEDSAWVSTFSEVGTVAPEWLEQVRQAIIAQLEPEPDAGKVVEMKPAASAKKKAK